MSGLTTNSAGVPTTQDLIEQSERIRNLEADTALKLQQIRFGRTNVAVAIIGVSVTAISILASSIQFIYTQWHPQPEKTYIFLDTEPSIML
jgi:hypothetical protein